MGSAKPPTSSRPPAASPASPDDDLLAGATIVTHGVPGALPGGTPVAPATGAPDAAPERPRGLTPAWQRLRLYGGALLMLLCFGLFGWQAWKGREPAAVTVQPLAPGGGAEIRVHVSGAVAQPGVYRLAQGDRVEDAIRAAGGFAADADTARINLAQRVRDEQRLDVPFLRPPAPDPGGATTSGPGAPAPAPPPPPTPAPGGASGAAGGPGTAAKVNVNTATAAQLEQLPGIGEVTARRIIAYREANGRITSLEQLRQAGLSDALLRRAADYLTFD